MKEFHISDVLTIITGKLVSTRHMEGVYDTLNYMTNDNLFTHQLPRAMEECRPYLLKQFPFLNNLNKNEITENNWEDWLNDKIEQFGDFLKVEQLPNGIHKYKNPIVEAIEIMQ